MYVLDAESRRFDFNICLSFSQPDIGQRSAQELLFSAFEECLELLFEDLCY